ncbi:MAG: TrpR-related protein YerC/YecD [Clostridiales bacterium]|jgi:TrpR-related protein YerC/YecD|nr:TrpR-related protein YerC/YecD [Clostridiales bacterium]
MDKSLFGELYDIISRIDNVKDCEYFFDDLCTKKEVEQMAQRVKAAKLLIEGKTYTQVIAETDISSATLSRVSRCVQYGKGYVRVLGRPKNPVDKK